MPVVFSRGQMMLLGSPGLVTTPSSHLVPAVGGGTVGAGVERSAFWVGA